MAARNRVQITILARDRASRNIAKVGTSISRLAKLALGGLGLGAIAIAARMAIRGITNLVEEAARLQGIERAFTGLAQAVGRSQEDMLSALEKGSKGMIAQRDLMRSFNLAAQLVSITFAEQLPEALGLLTKVSAATGVSMEYLLDSLVRGVGRLQPRIIDNLGVTLTLTEAYAAYGLEIGKSADALNRNEQQMAIMNLTMKKLRENVAAMPDLVGTLTYELARWQATGKNVKDMFARALTPAAGQFTRTINDMVARVLPDFTDFMLYTVAPALSILADAFDTAAKAALDIAEKFFADIIQTAGRDFVDGNRQVGYDAGEAFTASYGAKMERAAERALRWGVNIMVEFADGLIRGAVMALDWAMTFIGNILAGWLSGASPPKVAPEIFAWGVAAMTEWLKGFTEAEFDILEGIQGPLRDALEALVRAGMLDAEQVGSMFREITLGITQAIDEFLRTGVLDPAIFDKLTEAGGMFGKQLAELARRQFALAQVTREVLLAEEMLAKARKQEKEARKTIKALADEYNKLKRAGADKDILKAKLKEFLVARRQLSLAKKQGREAKEAVEDAEDRLNPLKMAVDLQERLLEQLTQLVESQKELAESEERARKEKAKKPVIPPFERPIFPAPDMSLLTKAFDDAKAKLKAKLADIFAPFLEKLGEWRGLVDGLALKWQWFTGIVSQFWIDKIKPIIADIKEALPENLPQWLGKVAIKMLILGGAAILGAAAILGMKVAFAALMSPLSLLILLIGLLAVAWEENWFDIQGRAETTAGVLENIVFPKISTALEGLAEKMQDQEGIWQTALGAIERGANQWWVHIERAWGAGLEAVADLVVAGLFAINGEWEEAEAAMTLYYEDAWDARHELALAGWDGILGLFGTNSEKFGEDWRTFWGSVGDWFAQLWEDITLSWEGIWPLWEGIWDNAKTIAETLWENIKTTIVTKWDNIKTSAETKWEEIKSTVVGKWDDIKTSAETTWDTIKTGAETAWDNIKIAITTKLEKLFEDMGLDLDDMKERWAQIWEDVKLIADEVWLRIKTAVAEKIEEVRADIETKILAIQTKWEEIWGAIKTFVTERVEEIRTEIETKILAIQTKWDEIWGSIKTFVTTAWDDIFTATKTKVEETRTEVETEVVAIQTKWDEVWGAIETTVTTIWDTIYTTIETKIGEVKTEIETVIGEIKTYLTNQWDNFKTLGGNLIEGMKEGVLGAVGGLIESVTKAIEDAIKAAKKALGMGSPSRLAAKQIGKPIAEGIGMGILENAPMNHMEQLIRMLMARGEQTVQTTYNFNQTVNTQASTMNILRDYEITRALLAT